MDIKAKIEELTNKIKGDKDILETIEDDEEFDRIADIFDDEFSDIFYDEEN